MTFAVPAEAYDRFVGRYSYALCQALADAAGITADSSVLDVGAGTGAGTQRLVDLVGLEHVIAVDPSESFVEGRRRRFPRRGVHPARAEWLPVDEDTFEPAEPPVA